MHFDKLSKPIFRRGIYINEEELYYLIEKFEDILVDGPPTAKREKIFDAYQTLAMTYFGEGDASNGLLENKLTLDLIVGKVSGLPSQSPVLKGIVLGDIKDPGKVPDERIEQLQIHISNSLDNLKDARKDLAGSMRDVHDDGVFYWIPEDYLP